MKLHAPRHLRNRHLLILDAVLLGLSTMLAYVVRFEGLDWGSANLYTALVYLAVSLPLKLGVLLYVGLYRRLWRFAGAAELEHILVATAISASLSTLLGAAVLPGLALTPLRVPLSVLFIDACLSAGAVALPRLFIRLFGRRTQWRRLEAARRVLIVGAGAAGELIVKELLGHPQIGLQPVGFVDDDPRKHGHRMLDLPVLGALRLKDLASDDVEEVIIAMPRAPGAVVARSSARPWSGRETRTVPGMFDILSGRVSVTSLREVQIEDLLRREPIQTDLAQVRDLATGETVLVTGAGGSIGSELCRQLARLEPARIMLLGHGENSIFDLCTSWPRAPRTCTARPRHRRRARPAAHAARLRALPALRRLPRRGAQARAADGRRTWPRR